MRMKIEVFGFGCNNCERLGEIVKKLVEALKIDAEIVLVQSWDKIMEGGIMMTPALKINGAEKCEGRMPSIAEVKRWILEAQKAGK